LSVVGHPLSADLGTDSKQLDRHYQKPGDAGVNRKRRPGTQRRNTPSL